MKNNKFILLSIILIALFSFFYISRDTPSEIAPSPNDMYLSNHEFNFIHLHKEDDPFALSSIEAMLNQDFDNFHIYLMLHEKELSFKNTVELFAKKENKSHLLTIVPIEENSPLPLIIKDLTESLKSESFVVYLEDHCIFARHDLLKELNTLYLEGGEKLLIFGNYRHYPSYQKNTKPLDFTTCPFKAFSVKHLQGMDHSVGTIHPDETLLFLDDPCYLRAR